MSEDRPDRVVTFDCYGTLIDFDLNGATRAALGDVVDRAGVDWEGFLHDFMVMRWQGIMEEYQPYRSVLRRCLRHTMSLHRLEYREVYGDSLIAAIPEFRAFPDVPPALAKLQPSYRLAIISNSDDELMYENVKRLGVEFDYVITAEQSRSYKPNAPMFKYALRAIGLPIDRVTHVAQGYEYDIIPTASMGMRRIWVNRRGRRGRSQEMPYEEIPDLSGLPELLGVSARDATSGTVG